MTNPPHAHQLISIFSLAKKDSFISTSIISPVLRFFTNMVGLLGDAMLSSTDVDSIFESSAVTSDNGLGLSSAENIWRGCTAAADRVVAGRGAVKAEATAKTARRLRTNRVIVENVFGCYERVICKRQAG